MKYSEYKELTPDQKELHDFELAVDTNKRVKETNGEVKDIKTWKSKAEGASAITALFIVPVLIWLIKNSIN